MYNCDIVIVDSGISCKLYETYKERIVGYHSFVKDDSLYVDNMGHGSAVFNIIMSNNKASVFIIKIFGEELDVDEEQLLNVLNYVNEKINCKLLHMSLGVTQSDNKAELYRLCKIISDKGTTIVSAFDNIGAISYPAAFPFVLGVDVSTECTKQREFVFVKNNRVNVLGYGGIQRTFWKDNVPFAFVSGTSFAAANITSFILENTSIEKLQDILKYLEENAIRCIECKNIEKRNTFTIQNAIALPANKEIYSLINYRELLQFNLLGIYDERRSGKVNKEIKSIYNNYRYIVQDYEKINWDDDFDTVIIGHFKEFEDMVKTKIKRGIVEKCIRYHKKVFSFDANDIDKDELDKENIYVPIINKSNVENTFGKMALINSPVLGIFGTSSQQGKYTLQLYIRKKFMEFGYKVAQLGTEPSALLFGMDSIFPMGYNSTVSLDFKDSITYLNYEMEKMDAGNPDIIIVGSQSNTAVYWPGNIRQYPMGQIELLMGTLPDAVILCINAYDNVDYIMKNIHVIEALSDAVVIGLALYPYIKADSSYILSKGSKMDSTQILKFKDSLNDIGLPIYIIGDESDMDRLILFCIDWFAGDNLP